MPEIMVKDVIAKILKEEGIDWYSGVHGGQIWNLMGSIAKAGIKLYHMRHEQCAVWMADGWARVTRRPGVCVTTCGPGYANTIPGLYLAYLAKSPVVCIFASHATMEDTWGSWQEAYPPKYAGPSQNGASVLLTPVRSHIFCRKHFVMLLLIRADR